MTRGSAPTTSSETTAGRSRTWKDWLGKWKMSSLRVKTAFLEAEWRPVEADRRAAWELYVELLTRIATQELERSAGSERTALASIRSLFSTTRLVLRRNGPDCQEFTKIAVLVMNQVLRPFTAKWHRLSLDGAFEQPRERDEFRAELEQIRQQLRTYMGMLAEMADVEDLTDLEHN